MHFPLTAKNVPGRKTIPKTCDAGNQHILWYVKDAQRTLIHHDVYDDGVFMLILPRSR